MKPTITIGGTATDTRGVLKYNNDFDMSPIKRMYLIHNKNLQIKRGWQGHLIESRWFQPVTGSYLIEVVCIDKESKNYGEITAHVIHAENTEVLHVPAGYATCIIAQSTENKLMVYADYLMNEVSDEQRFELDYFNNE